MIYSIISNYWELQCCFYLLRPFPWRLIMMLQNCYKCRLVCNDLILVPIVRLPLEVQFELRTVGMTSIGIIPDCLWWQRNCGILKQSLMPSTIVASHTHPLPNTTATFHTLLGPSKPQRKTYQIWQARFTKMATIECLIETNQRMPWRNTHLFSLLSLERRSHVWIQYFPSSTTTISRQARAL